MTNIESLKKIVEQALPENDGFESYVFSIGRYNDAVGDSFKIDMDCNSAGILILSTPDMFDISFKRWVQEKVKELGSLNAVGDQISSPIQEFMTSRLSVVEKQLDIPYELLHDYSMTTNRRPKILVQTCGHISGAAYYYQPRYVENNDWNPQEKMTENLKFIGLSLHPIYGGHFAFRSVFLFPSVKINFNPIQPKSILSSDDEIRTALEKFNYSWKDSGFRDFGGPTRRYSETQVEFFGKPPAERWEVLKKWC